jgi:hypothetical protein
LAPNNPRLLEEQGKVLILFARHYRAVGDIKAARDAATRAGDLYTQLEAKPESATGATRLRSVALDDRGNTLLAEGDRAGALKAYEESLQIDRRLTAADPGNAVWARDLIVFNVKLAGVADNPAMVRKHYAAALAITRDLARSGRLAPADGWSMLYRRA